MYHLLTGRLPFQGANNFSLLYQITNVEAEPPSVFRPETPAKLDAIVRRAMAKDLDQRYRRWEEFSLDLAEAFRVERLRAQKTQEFSDSDKFETLRKLAFFEHFSDAELWEVARMSSWRHAAAGEALIKEGELASSSASSPKASEITSAASSSRPARRRAVRRNGLPVQEQQRVAA